MTWKVILASLVALQMGLTPVAAAFGTHGTESGRFEDDGSGGSARAAAAASALCGETPADSGAQPVDLSTFEGRTFYQAMKDGQGIKQAFDRDQLKPFHVTGADALHTFSRNVDPSVTRKAADLFRSGESGLDQLADALAEMPGISGAPGVFSPATFRLALRNALNAHKNLLTPKAASAIPLTAAKLAPLLALSSGAGTLVRIDSQDCYLSYGYADGSQSGDEKSGRSFGVARGHAALDPSDIYYLRSLGRYLDPSRNADPSAYYNALMKVLTQSDTSGFRRLDTTGRTVATDFLAIYTAEHDRYLMSGERTHSWQNDLAEATLLSAYVTASGKVYDKAHHRLVDGDPTAFFGVGTSGSGLGGRLRAQRVEFQQAVTRAERSLHPEVIENLEAIIGPTRDVFHGVLNYLNNRNSDQASVRENADGLTEAVTALTSQIREDAGAITSFLEKGSR
jgi:hypothetical protein